MGPAKHGRENAKPVVGASLLAMDVNDNSGYLNNRVAQAFFTSELAPAELTVHL
jgi:hypothetical protein